MARGRMSTRGTSWLVGVLIIAVGGLLALDGAWRPALFAWSLLAPYGLCFMPRQCAEQTRRGHACRLTAFGLLFGCHRYHWSHPIRRIVRLRLRPKPAVERTLTVAAAGPIPEPRPGRAYDAVMLAATVAGAVAGIAALFQSPS